MRITIVMGPYFPVPPVSASGVEKMWYGLARAFAAKNHEVVMVSRRFGDLPQEQDDSGVRHIRIPSINAPRSKLAYRSYDAIYSARARAVLPPGADILVSNCMWLPIFVRGTRFGSVYVHVARRPKGQMWLYRHAPRIQTVSNTMKAAIVAEKGMSPERVTVIPPFVAGPARAADMQKRSADRQKEVIYAGRIHPEKGVEILIGAFGKLAKSDWQLTIIGPHEFARGGGGDAYLHRLRQRVSKFAGRVTFAGSVSEAELMRQYEAASLLVYPSVSETGESFGAVPLEAMAWGCPVIVSGLECFREFVLGGINACVFDHRAADREDRLALEMERLMGDGALRDSIAEKGLETARRYTLDAIADRFIGDFEHLSSRR